MSASWNKQKQTHINMISGQRGEEWAVRPLSEVNVESSISERTSEFKGVILASALEEIFTGNLTTILVF